MTNYTKRFTFTSYWDHICVPDKGVKMMKSRRKGAARVRMNYSSAFVKVLSHGASLKCMLWDPDFKLTNNVQRLGQAPGYI